MCDPYRVKILRKVSVHVYAGHVEHEYKYTHVAIHLGYVLLGYVFMKITLSILGHRRLCVPRLRPLGEEGRGPESGGPLREHAAH